LFEITQVSSAGSFVITQVSPIGIVRNEVRVLIWSPSVKMPLDCTITEKFPNVGRSCWTASEEKFPDGWTASGGKVPFWFRSR
jgi:hypothetical protein